MNYKEFNPPFVLSVLTTEPLKGNEVIITGYSQNNLEKGDTIEKGKYLQYEIIEELERRDAVGNFTKTSPKDLWYKAKAIIKKISV